MSKSSLYSKNSALFLVDVGVAGVKLVDFELTMSCVFGLAGRMECKFGHFNAIIDAFRVQSDI